ncbi:MAG: sulfatase [Geminicoccaceae bacterium]
MLRRLALACLALAGLAVGIAPASAAKPNLVVIMLDDLDAAAVQQMPGTLAQVAQAGLTFDRAYTVEPTCFPSRAAFFTGRYPHSTGMRVGGYAKFVTAGLEANTLGPWLQQAGYYTAFAGKYINDYPRRKTDTYVPAGWNRWAAGLYEDFYAQYNYRMNEDGVVVSYGAAPTDYFTDVLSRKAVDFIADAKARAKPLALFVKPTAPHSPLVIAPRHTTLFAGVTIPRSASIPENLTGDKPPFLRAGIPPAKTMADYDKKYRWRLRMLAAADELVVAVINALQANAMLDNTYIFVTSDNGYHLGEHNVAEGKNTGWEEDVRVPLLVRGPGVPAGERRSQMVLNTDLAPTLVALGGGTVPAKVQGRSLLPLLGAAPPANAPWRQAILLTYKTGTPPVPPATPPVATAPYTCVPTATPVNKVPDWWGVRTLRYTYVEYSNGDRELYDTLNDPLQLRNIFCSADPVLKASLAAKITSLRACTDGATCAAAEDALAP